MSAWSLAAAVLLDRILGDPPRLPHPVVGIGRLAATLEGRLRPRQADPRRELWGGIWLVVLLVLLVVGAAWLIGWALGRLHPWLAAAWDVGLMAMLLAGRGLADAGSRVAGCLEAGDLPAAREAVSALVGRDTAQLTEAEVARAAVESVAENASDGLVAPLFYGVVGGPALAAAYKAVNTLDSMYGYRDPRNLYFGRAAARLDDWANWLPARLTALLLVAAAPLVGLSARRGWRVLRRDGRRHPSPNAGQPEAAMAGALGVRLGGRNQYGGRPSSRPELGTAMRPLDAARVREAVSLFNVAAWTAAVGAVAALWMFDQGMP